MRGLIGVLGLVLAIAGAGCCEAPRVSSESREYRYWCGSHADDHRNLQWRLEQIETKLNQIEKKLPPG